MSQASQALNLCYSTIEFSGSAEQVEGERLLLVASKYHFFGPIPVERITDMEKLLY
jgi:hypothetical protein